MQVLWEIDLINCLTNFIIVNMKNFRITYRMEVTIQAETQEEAQEIFDNQVDVYNLEEMPNAEYVEQVSIDEV